MAIKIDLPNGTPTGLAGLKIRATAYLQPRVSAQKMQGCRGPV